MPWEKLHLVGRQSGRECQLHTGTQEIASPCAIKTRNSAMLQRLSLSLSLSPLTS